MTAHNQATLEALAAFPALLRKRLQTLDDAVLRFRPQPDAWSIIEIVGHIVEVNALWVGRIRHILAAEYPMFPPYNPDAAVRNRDYQHKQVDGLLTAFAEQRADLVAFAHLLQPTQLARTGEHAVRGTVSVADALAILAAHDQSHDAQIYANIEAWAQRTAAA